MEQQHNLAQVASGRAENAAWWKILSAHLQTVGSLLVVLQACQHSLHQVAVMTKASHGVSAAARGEMMHVRHIEGSGDSASRVYAIQMLQVQRKVIVCHLGGCLSFTMPLLALRQKRVTAILCSVRQSKPIRHAPMSYGLVRLLKESLSQSQSWSYLHSASILDIDE